MYKHAVVVILLVFHLAASISQGGSRPLCKIRLITVDNFGSKIPFSVRHFREVDLGDVPRMGLSDGKPLTLPCGFYEYEIAPTSEGWAVVRGRVSVELSQQVVMLTTFQNEKSTAGDVDYPPLRGRLTGSFHSMEGTLWVRVIPEFRNSLPSSSLVLSAVGSDGRFTFPNVVPGKYIVVIGRDHRVIDMIEATIPKAYGFELVIDLGSRKSEIRQNPPSRDE